MATKKKKMPDNTIAQNRKATHDYFIENTYEAGLSLLGWEVKAMREKKANLTDAYIVIHQGEAYLHSCHVSPLITTSTHVIAEPTRNRKLLLHAAEIIKLIVAIEKDGYTVVPLSLYWIKNKVKLKIGVAKGKKLHDKRATEKEKEWNKDKQRIMKNNFE